MAESTYTVVSDGEVLLESLNKAEAEAAYDKAMGERTFTTSLQFLKTIIIESAEVGVVQVKKRRTVNPDKKRKPKDKSKSKGKTVEAAL